MVDPILNVLYQGGGILARQIVNTYLPNAGIVEQEMAIEILERGFRAGSSRAWTRVRTDIVQGLQSVLHPRIGTERTSTLLNGIETQINRVARENGIEEPERGWLTISEQNAADQVPEHLRETAIRDAPLELTPEQLEVQRRHRQHFNRANEYAERQEMGYEDEQSMHQQQRDISNEVFAGTFISQFAPWNQHLTKLLKQL
jgi:hypothetical protein